MDAMANPYRMQIIEQIYEKGYIRCCDVVELTGLSQPTCTHHIKLLADSGLIDCKKAGRNNIFTINAPNFHCLKAYLEKFSHSSPTLPKVP